MQFKREFLSAHMNRTLLREVYRRNGIKKKALKWTKGPKNPDPEADRKTLSNVKRQLTRNRNAGYRIVYGDECCVTRKTMTDTEWTRRKENMTVDQAKLNEPTLALLASISKERGLEHWQIFPKSVNTAKFKEWLAGLRAANPNEKICLFLDNLGAHTCDASTKEMRRLKFRYIFNVRYSPQ